MFDKNRVKNEFRAWSEQFPFELEKDVIFYINQLIPNTYKKENFWLIEQSLQWYFFKQDSLKREMLNDIKQEEFV